MNKFSPYYTYFLRGKIFLSTPSKINLAIECFQKSLEYKKTFEAYDSLLMAVAKTGNVDLYESTLLSAASNGFKEFYSSCGSFYAKNKQKCNFEKALDWFEKGMREDDPKSLYELGNLYVNGSLVFETNMEKAEDVLLKGLNLNDSKWNGTFNFLLGKLYFDTSKYDKAKIHLEKASQAGILQANYQLALLYKDGLGVDKDHEKYMDYLLKHLDAQTAKEIAGIFLDGEIAPVDNLISFTFFDYATTKGDPIAAIMCAGFLVSRKEYNKNDVIKYLDIAFKNGYNNENIISSIDTISSFFDDSVRKELNEIVEKYCKGKNLA